VEHLPFRRAPGQVQPYNTSYRTEVTDSILALPLALRALFLVLRRKADGRSPVGRGLVIGVGLRRRRQQVETRLKMERCGVSGCIVEIEVITRRSLRYGTMSTRLRTQQCTLLGHSAPTVVVHGQS